MSMKDKKVFMFDVWSSVTRNNICWSKDINVTVVAERQADAEAVIKERYTSNGRCNVRVSLKQAFNIFAVVESESLMEAV